MWRFGTNGTLICFYQKHRRHDHCGKQLTKEKAENPKQNISKTNKVCVKGQINSRNFTTKCEW